MARKDTEIPDSELEVLVALWGLGEGTVREVRQDLSRKGRRLAHNTVLTLLGRLEGRGHVACDRGGNANVYRALTARNTVAEARLDALVKQLGEGRATPLILQLVESHRLTKQDIREVRKVLNRLEKEAKAAEEEAP